MLQGLCTHLVALGHDVRDADGHVQIDPISRDEREMPTGGRVRDGDGGEERYQVQARLVVFGTRTVLAFGISCWRCCLSGCWTSNGALAFSGSIYILAQAG